MEHLPALPLQQMPSQIEIALGLRTAPAEPPPTGDFGFGITARVRPEPTTEEEIEFGVPLAIAKLFAADVPIFSAALAGPITPRPEQPRTFLEDYDSEEVEAARAIEPIRRLFYPSAERILESAAAPAEPAESRLVKRELTIAPPTPAEKKPAPTSEEIVYRLRQTPDGSIWREGYIGDDLKSARIVTDADEILTVKRKLLKTVTEHHVTEHDDGEPISLALVAALDEVGEQDEEETDFAFVGRLNQALSHLASRPILSIVNQ